MQQKVPEQLLVLQNIIFKTPSLKKVAQKQTKMSKMR